MFHGIQVAIMFALMTNIIQFAYWKQKGKSQKPIYILCVATVLIMIQPTSMMVIGAYHDAALAAHDDDGPANIPPAGKNFFFDGDDDANALWPNTAIGWCGGRSGDSGLFERDVVAAASPRPGLSGASTSSPRPGLPGSSAF